MTPLTPKSPLYIFAVVAVGLAIVAAAMLLGGFICARYGVVVFYELAPLCFWLAGACLIGHGLAHWLYRRYGP